MLCPSQYMVDLLIMEGSCEQAMFRWMTRDLGVMMRRKVSSSIVRGIVIAVSHLSMCYMDHHWISAYTSTYWIFTLGTHHSRQQCLKVNMDVCLKEKKLDRIILISDVELFTEWNFTFFLRI